MDSSVWYKDSIGPRLKPKVREVYEKSTGLKGDELINHIHQIREKAWTNHQYPCIGEWMFLLPSISNFPQYPHVLARAKQGDRILDLGCGLAQDLRYLAADGAPSENLYASDISPELWNFGFDLFKDHDRMAANFVAANLLDDVSELRKWDGMMDVIIANMIIHLFDWDGQIVALKNLVELSRPGALVLGYQRAQVPPVSKERPWGTMYFHDENTFRQIWEIVQQKTHQVWDLEIRLVPLSEWGMEPEDVEWMPEGKVGLNFVAKRTA